MRTRVRIAVATAVAAAVATGTAPRSAAAVPEGGPPPAPVRVEEVRRERLREQRSIPGHLRAVRRTVVAAREAGVVLEVGAREGATVAAGDLLARLDAERLRLDAAVLDAEIAAAGAGVDEARLVAAQATRDAEALADLARRSAARPKEVDDAATARDAAEARVRSAMAGVAVLRARAAVLARRIADTEVRAPFAGQVIVLRAEVGSWIGEGDGVVELIAGDALEVRLDVPQRSLAALVAAGAAREPLRALVDATGAALELPEWRIVGDVDPASRTFPVLARVAATPGLAPGLSVTASVPTGAEADHVTVSRDAILRGPTGPYVVLAAGGGGGAPASAAFAPVEVLFSVGDRAAVRGDGIVAGARAVVEGNERLFPGAPLRPMDAASTAPAAPAPGGGR